MKNFTHKTLLILGIFLTAVSCSKKNETSYSIRAFDSQTAKKIDSIADEFIKTKKALGYSIAIMHKKDTLYAKGFGFQDINRTKPFTHETIFQIASVSKFITSIAVLKLVENGKLTLNTKVSDVLPSYPFKEDADKIEIKHLLQHTSGIREYGFIADSLLAGIRDTIDSKVLFNLYNHLPTEFEAGSNFSYSNSGFLLVSLIVEEVTGKSYRDIIQDEVCEPLGLTVLDTWKNNSQKENISLEFVLEDSTFIKSKFNEIKWLLGDGGLSANSIELAQIPYLVFSESFLSKSLIDEILQSPHLKNGAISDYGLGLRKGELFKEPVWAHTGGGSTSTNVLTYYPESEISIAIQVNTDNTSLNAIEIESKILPIIFENSNVKLEPLKPDKEVLKEYEGFFVESPRYPHKKRIIQAYVHNDGNLYRKIKGSQSIGQKLIPIGKETFIPDKLPLDRIVFDRNHKGDVIAMKDYYNGHFMALRNKEME